MAKAVEELYHKLGDSATIDLFERTFYARDLAPVPDLLGNRMVHSMPDLVVRPDSPEEIGEVMKFAAEERMPVTPRAGATTAFFNAVPVKGGIVLDTTGLKGIIDIDRENLQVRAWAGSSWKEINEELLDDGLTACSVPSSAEASTIGGWFNMEGYGIGSSKYGGFHHQVQGAEVVLADGRVLEATENGLYPIRWFAGSEGTLGVISHFTFQVRPVPEYTGNYAIEYSTVNQVREALEILNQLPEADTPYHVHWSNEDFHFFLQQLAYEIPTSKHLLLLNYQGNKGEAARGEKIVQDLIRRTEGILLDREIADAEWAERYRSLRIKRGGPTLLAAEVVVPVAKLEPFCRQLKKMGQRTAVYGHRMDRSRLNVLVMYHGDETKTLEYLFLLAKTKIIYEAALGLGGRPYGFGLWNSVYLKRAYGRDTILPMKERKKMLDPLGIINPGKTINPPGFLHPALFAAGAGSANLISRAFGIGRGK